MSLVPAFGLFGVVVAADLVVLEIAGELGGALLLEQPLEPAPRRVAHLLTAPFGEIQVLNDLIEVDVALLGHGLIGLFVFEFVGFGLLSHAGTRQPCGHRRPALKSDSLTTAMSYWLKVPPRKARGSRSQ